MTVQEMTVNEYAEMRGIRPEAVRKAISLGHKTPGVIKVTRFGKAYKLYVHANTAKKNKKIL